MRSQNLVFSTSSLDSNLRRSQSIDFGLSLLLKINLPSSARDEALFFLLAFWVTAKRGFLDGLSQGIPAPGWLLLGRLDDGSPRGAWALLGYTSVTHSKFF